MMVIIIITIIIITSIVMTSSIDSFIPLVNNAKK